MFKTGDKVKLKKNTKRYSVAQLKKLEEKFKKAFFAKHGMLPNCWSDITFLEWLEASGDQIENFF